MDRNSKGKNAVSKLTNVSEIRKNSGGFPIILHEWINDFNDLNPEMINSEIICENVEKSKIKLNDEEQMKLNQLTVLQGFISQKEIASILNMNLNELDPFINKLIQYDIFRRTHSVAWFRHDWVQNCLERRLDEDNKKDLHLAIAKYFLESLDRESVENASEGILDYRGIGLAFHLYSCEVSDTVREIEDE